MLVIVCMSVSVTASQRNVLVEQPGDEHVYFRALNAFCLHAMVSVRINEWMNN